MNELDFLNNDNIENRIKNFYMQYKIELDFVRKTDSFQIEKYFYKINNAAKIKKINNLIDELELFIKAKKIKLDVDNLNGYIVFEISKKDRKILRFSELRDNIAKGITACFGKDTNNNEISVDISKAPHLLIAGSTGSGKSCLLNSVIQSLNNKYDEEYLKFILVDIKQVEFLQYKNLKKIATPVITNANKAFNILNKMIVIMSSRYEILSKKNCKNVQEYNEKEKEKMCYYAIIIDELADLMMQFPEIETLICRLAQLGRAAGIHLILATQRPDSQTLTGKIKINIPTRIALTVTNVYDSKIILDEPGAEKLTGCGDFIFKKSNGEKIRGQAALI